MNGLDGITVSWSPPLVLQTISKYTVSIQQHGNTYDVFGNVTFLNISNLTMLQSYTFSVYAVDSYGNRSTSAVSNTLFLGAPTYYYKFDQGSVNGNHQVLNYATGNYDAYVYGNDNPISSDTVIVNNGSLRLDGNTFVVMNNTDVVASTGVTIASWFKYVSGGWSRLFDFANGPSNNNILYAPGNGTSLFYGGIPSLYVDVSGKNDNSWHYFTWTIDTSGNSNVYIDGLLVQYRVIAYPVIVERHNNYIGRSNWGGDPLAVGYVANFMVFPYALTSSQVTQIQNTPLPL